MRERDLELENTRTSSALPGCVLQRPVLWVRETALREGQLGWQGLQNENKGLVRMMLESQQVSAAVCH